MRKRWAILLGLLVLFSIVLVYARNLDSGKVVFTDNHNVNSTGKIISTENLSVGDIFYLDDGRKARVTGVEDVAGNFDNLNFFANGVLVHNKDKKELIRQQLERYEEALSNKILVIKHELAKGEVIGAEEIEQINLVENAYFDKIRAMEEEGITPMYECSWGTRYAGKLEKIIIDKPDVELAKKIRNIEAQTFAFLSDSPSEAELTAATVKFSQDLRVKLPFLAGNSPPSEDVWRLYISKFDNGPAKLSELGASGWLDCTGQHLTIRQSLLDDGWELYNAVFCDLGKGAAKTRTHTVLAKKFGDYAALIDPLEGSFTQISTSGRYFVQKWGDFSASFVPSKIVPAP